MSTNSARTKTFQVYGDPGHAWVKVKIELLLWLGIARDITPCSYIRGEWAYLEEDCDASLFHETMEKVGITPVYKTHTNANKQSKIRNYNRYYLPE